jgi:uncharacterized protein YxeA
MQQVAFIIFIIIIIIIITLGGLTFHHRAEAGRKFRKI